MPLYSVPFGVFGSDCVRYGGDLAHIYFQWAWQWHKFNIITGAVVLNRDWSVDGVPTVANPEIPAASTLCYDIDENNIIYTGASVGTNLFRLVKLDGVTLEKITDNGTTWSASPGKYGGGRYRVVKNSNAPFLYFRSVLHLWRLWVVHRSTLAYGSENYWEVICPEDVQQIAVDDDNGRAYAVCSDPSSSALSTYIMVVDGPGDTGTEYDVSAYIAAAERIAFDKATRKLIVGSQKDGSSASDDVIAFFDADSLGDSGGGFLSKLDLPNNAIGSYDMSTWHRGIVNGHLWIEDGSVNDRIHKIDVANESLVATYNMNVDSGVNAQGGGVYDPLTHSFFQMVNESTFNAAKILLDRGVPQTVKLSTIVAAICGEVGLTAGDIDVTALTDDVRGYVVDARMSARAALEPLMGAYFFDCVESEGKLKFVKRGGASAVSIPETDLAAHFADQQRPQELLTTRQQDIELPIQVDVSYVEQDSDYQPGCQYERRWLTNSEHLLNLRLPIVLDCDEAKQIAVITLGLAWLQRTRYRFALARKYAYLEPTDVITVTEGGVARVMRIDQIEYSGGVLQVSATREDAAVYVSDAEGVPPPAVDDTVDYEGVTLYELIDCPVIRDHDDGAGIYTATAGLTDYWHGATIYRSLDNGSSWSFWFGETQDAIIGYATAALADVNDPNVWDRGNSVNIRLVDANDSLTAATEAQVLNGSNLAILGNEIINFTTIVEEDDGSFTISGLLRGRKGTEWATDDHAVGDRFVLLNFNYIDHHFIPVGDHEDTYPNGVYYHCVSAGLGWTMGITKQLVTKIRSLMPYAPCHIAGSRDGSNDLTITWIRRNRLFGEWRSSVGVPMSEDSEAYEVDIIGDSSGDVLRTITGLSSPTATYTAAQQTTDGITPGDPVIVRVYQISALIGRGFAAEETV